MFTFRDWANSHACFLSLIRLKVIRTIEGISWIRLICRKIYAYASDVTCASDSISHLSFTRNWRVLSSNPPLSSSRVTPLYLGSFQWKKVMARVTRSRRKMANTTDAPSPASSLLSSTTTTPFTGPTSTTYSTEGYTFNYSGLPSLGGYSFEDLNYTELWVDVWNSTEASNATERLNTTVLSSGGGYCDEWEAAQHKLFQVSFCNELDRSTLRGEKIIEEFEIFVLQW